MDPNQTQDPTMNPAPVADPGMPAVDPNAGMQVPAEPVAPSVPEPVAMPTPEPVSPVAPAPEAPVTPSEPVAPAEPQRGDVNGGQMPPTTPPPAI